MVSRRTSHHAASRSINRKSIRRRTLRRVDQYGCASIDVSLSGERIVIGGLRPVTHEKLNTGGPQLHRITALFAILELQFFEKGDRMLTDGLWIGGTIGKRADAVIPLCHEFWPHHFIECVGRLMRHHMTIVINRVVGVHCTY